MFLNDKRQKTIVLSKERRFSSQNLELSNYYHTVFLLMEFKCERNLKRLNFSFKIALKPFRNRFDKSVINKSLNDKTRESNRCYSLILEIIQ